MIGAMIDATAVRCPQCNACIELAGLINDPDVPCMVIGGEVLFPALAGCRCPVCGCQVELPEPINRGGEK